MTTIQTIAKLANVSKSTVSNAFNNPEALSPETRNHIFKICKEHDYRRDFFEKKNKQDTQTIIEFNLYSPHSLSDFSQRILKGVIDEANIQNVKILISIRDTSIKQNALVTQEIAGRIIVNPTIKDQYQRSLSTVIIGNTQRKVSYISQINNHMDELIQEATDLLINLDHRHILFLNSDKIKTVSHQYLWGFKQALQKNNILFSNTNHYMVPSHADIAEYVYQLIRSKPYILDNITAIIVTNTQMAIGVYRAVSDLGLNIPKDISILSLSKNRPIDHLKPKLSYFDLNPEKIGQMALIELLSLLKGNPTKEIHIEHKFMSQESITYAKN